jgi:hypothetical protein
MYNHYSLANSLKIAGLTDARQFEATESHIAQWSSFTLNTEPDGRTYKPDSPFMEAIRP